MSRVPPAERQMHLTKSLNEFVPWNVAALYKLISRNALQIVTFSELIVKFRNLFHTEQF